MNIHIPPSSIVGYQLENSQEAIKRASQAALLDILKARERGTELHTWMKETREALKTVETATELRQWKDRVTKTVHSFMNDMMSISKHIQFMNPPLTNEQVRKLIEIIHQERTVALSTMEPVIADLTHLNLVVRDI
jgi:hypothetical protein